MLLNPRLAGLMTEKGMVVGKGNWEPILKTSQLTALTALLSAPERTRGLKSGRHPANLLTRLMRCARCDRTVRAGGRGEQLSYICPNWHTTVPREDSDQLVLSSVASVLATVQPQSVLRPETGASDEQDDFEEVSTLRERQGILAQSFARGLISTEAYEDAVSEIASAIERIETGYRETVMLPNVRVESVRNFLELPMMDQRALLARIAVITLHQAVRGKAGALRQIEVSVKARRGQEGHIASRPRQADLREIAVRRSIKTHLHQI